MPAISKRRRARPQGGGFPACAAARVSRWKSSVSVRVLDQFCAGVILADDDGKVIEMNRAAEAILQMEDGLRIPMGSFARGGSLRPRDWPS